MARSAAGGFNGEVTFATASRHAGMLLHVTSLPGAEGIGTLGTDARAFVDLLAAARFDTWQMLPVNPAGPGFSPYAAESSFAGSPLFVSIAGLVADGCIDGAEASPPPFSTGAVAVERVAAWKERMLRRAFAGSGRYAAEIGEFAERNAGWLDDWALFAALRDRHGPPWQSWPAALARRERPALIQAHREFSEDVAFHRFAQWCFDRQWRDLQEYARSRGVSLFGDLPIFPALQSADVWANQGTFKLDARGWPEVVAGVPPDLFSATGQHWGNPHYRWDAEEAAGFGYWVRRLRRAFELYDVLRIDHFRGFAAAWEIPADSETAVDGRWVDGPGERLFVALSERLGPMAIVVEDLGVITPDVVELRRKLGYPGMLVLQFAFDGSPENPYLPANHGTDAVVYAGTHDNDTTVGWWDSLSAAERATARKISGRPFNDPAGELMLLAMESPASLAVVTMQDALRLDGRARMNTPGRAVGNWRWRFDWPAAEPGLADQLRALVAAGDRLPGSVDAGAAD